MMIEEYQNVEESLITYLKNIKNMDNIVDKYE